MQTLSHDALVRALAETPSNPWPTIDNRASWEQIAQKPGGAAVRDLVLAAAEEFAQKPLVMPSLTEFIAFSRTGDRSAWEKSSGALSYRLTTATLAACFTNDARWVDQAADVVWLFCEMTTWVINAHEGAALPDPDFPNLDLGAAMRAQTLTETVQLLGPALDRIDGRLRRRVRREMDKRIFEPFLARGDFFWLSDRTHPMNNWNAVCVGGILIAALEMLKNDPERQARVVGKAVWSLGYFKDAFGDAGSLDEGVGYWTYGMTYYTMAAERLLARTGGKIDLLGDPKWRDVAAFPAKANLYGDTFVDFSDCPSRVKTSPGWISWLGQHTNTPGLLAWAARTSDTQFNDRGLPLLLRQLFWQTNTNDVSAAPRALSAFLPDVEWLIARASSDDNALVLAAKGGHNAENHNHNDVGSFIVHYQQEALLAELGAPTYTRQFFSGERYQNISARSLGHSVPFANGQEQRSGRNYAARVLAHGDGALSLDLTAPYPPEAQLVRLQRDLALHRDLGEGTITLSDTAVFAVDNATFALPLVTKNKHVEVVASGHACIRGERGQLDIHWNATQATCRAETVSTDDPKFQQNSESILQRLWFDIAVSDKTARLDLTITPSSCS